jgi:hypothetical protein
MKMSNRSVDGCGLVTCRFSWVPKVVQLIWERGGACVEWVMQVTQTKYRLQSLSLTQTVTTYHKY